jgi:putative DNA primase/helicase
MVDLARDEPGTPISHTDLDADPWLFNVLNGTLDLRTGELQPHDRGDLITKLAPVTFDPDAECPQWDAFLQRITGGDENLIRFLQRAAGHTLTGDISEQCLFFLHGRGQNGKTTFIETLMTLLGDYAQKAPTQMLIAKPNAIPNDIARLPGARFVVAAEVEEGRPMAESLVKDLTGGDTLVARFLHQEYFEFRPSHKLWIYGNHRPLIQGTDEGIWRRIHLIPFDVWIPPGERDTRLIEKLRAELSGILNWAVRGCLEWQEHRLGTPEAVHQATSEYRSEMDVLGRFIEERCITQPDAQGRADELYRAYCDWCQANGEDSKTGTAFGRRLKERGFDKRRDSNGVYYVGIGLLAR